MKLTDEMVNNVEREFNKMQKLREQIEQSEKNNQNASQPNKSQAIKSL